MSEPVDISDVVTDLCAALGQNKWMVSRIVLTPDTATVEVFLDDGKGKYILGEAGPAMDTLQFDVLT